VKNLQQGEKTNRERGKQNWVNLHSLSQTSITGVPDEGSPGPGQSSALDEFKEKTPVQKRNWW